MSTTSDKVSVLDVLTMLRDKQQSCSPILLSIGFTDPKSHQVKNDRVVIHECPPSVLEAVVDLCGYRASMTKEGLVIMCDE